MLNARVVSRIVGIGVAVVAVAASTRVAHAQSGPPGADPPPPPQGYPPPPPQGYPPPPPQGYPPPPPAYAPQPYAPQPYAPQPEPPGIHRSGLVIGFSLGAGTIGCSDCTNSDSLNGVAVDLHIGGMLSPNVALMFDGSAVVHSLEGGGTLTHVVDTLAVQVWVNERLWLKGGLGIGQLSVSDNESSSMVRSDTRAAAMLALGVELLQGRSSALDLQLRGAATSFSDATLTNGSILIGYSWY
jgi:hypothetical protein